jgi:hypothetical protein
VRESPSEPPEAAGGDRLARLRESWAAIVRETARLSMGAANLLKDAWPESVDGDRVTIAVDSEFKQEITALESPRHRMSLESALRRVLGPDATVSFVAADKGRPGSGRQADKGPPAAAPDAEDTAGQPRGQRAAPAGSPKKGKAWADDPSVRKVMETFNSTIVEVRE